MTWVSFERHQIIPARLLFPVLGQETVAFQVPLSYRRWNSNCLSVLPINDHVQSLRPLKMNHLFLLSEEVSGFRRLTHSLKLHMRKQEAISRNSSGEFVEFPNSLGFLHVVARTIRFLALREVCGQEDDSHGIWNMMLPKFAVLSAFGVALPLARGGRWQKTTSQRSSRGSGHRNRPIFFGLLSMVRNISPSGVRRIMNSIDDENEGPGVSKGYSSAGCLPVVVMMPEEYLHIDKRQK